MAPDNTKEARTAPCCSVTADPRIARQFDAKARALDQVADFPPLLEVSARLLDMLRDAPVSRPSVLELGCGTGGLAVALLQMGAQRVHGLDLSPGSIEVARRRAAQAGFAEQAVFGVGNAADAKLEAHDWTVLDRVICCFDDAERLLANAQRSTRRRLAISIPESRGWRGLVNRPLWAAEAAWDTLTGGCRGYVHDIRRIERQLAQAGFRALPGRQGHSGLWYIGVYERA